MSAARIWCYQADTDAWVWECSCDPDVFEWGYSSAAAAADAGREHLRQAHPEVVWAAGGNVYPAEAVDGPEAYVPLPRIYCFTHGVKHSCSLTRGARSDADAEKVSVEVQSENGPENGAQHKQLPNRPAPTACPCLACLHDAGVQVWWMNVCDDCGNKRCPHGVNHRHQCTYDNPLQTARNQSREDC